MYDFHIHNNFSKSNKNIDSLVMASIYKSLKTICFIESFNDNTYNNIDFLEEILRVKYLYSNYINILAGLEINMDIDNTDILDNFIDNNNFDYIVLSYKSKYFKNPTSKKEAIDIIRKYYIHILNFLNVFDNYDAISHLDHIDKILIKNNIKIDYCYYQDLVLEILKTLIKKDKALEISSAGLRCKIKNIFPKEEILNDYVSLGGELITLGSNAMKDDNLAFAFKDIQLYLNELGINNIYYYDFREAYKLQF